MDSPPAARGLHYQIKNLVSGIEQRGCSGTLEVKFVGSRETTGLQKNKVRNKSGETHAKRDWQRGCTR